MVHEEAEEVSEPQKKRSRRRSLEPLHTGSTATKRIGRETERVTETGTGASTPVAIKINKMETKIHEEKYIQPTLRS